MGKRQWYAVRNGRQTGIFSTWLECRSQVDRFPMAEYKSFSLKSEAQRYLSSSSPPKNSMNELLHLLQYDGASKGNPGKAGAGALLIHPDGSKLQELRIGLGTATNNFAEYHGLILGLKAALEKGISRIRVQGDSNLVCKQVAGVWKVNKDTLIPLHAEAQDLSTKFTEFSIEHIPRELNAAADELANKAIVLQSQEIARNELSTIVQVPDSSPVPQKKKRKTDDEAVYLLVYDGASKGNPGKAGAGALLRNPKGSVVEKLYMGLGIATNNVAEYEALILGLKAAIKRNVNNIQVLGDSNLVCKQVSGEWAVRHQDLKPLHAEVQVLSKQFAQFAIHHIDREFNTEADALANKGTTLPCRTIVSKPSRKTPSEVPKGKHADESPEIFLTAGPTAQELPSQKNACKVETVTSEAAGAKARSQPKKEPRKAKKDPDATKSPPPTQRKKSLAVSEDIKVSKQRTRSTRKTTDATVERYVVVDPAPKISARKPVNQVPNCVPSAAKASYRSYSTFLTRLSARPAVRPAFIRSLSTMAAVALVTLF